MTPISEPDPSRYDDALYGQLDSGAQEAQHDPAYADDPYAYQDGYGDGAEEPVQKRRGGMVTVVVVLALAVLGTGAAFAYRTYVGSPRSGEPPIIKADTGPTKIVPAPADGSAKVPDRMAAGDGTEKIVPREEAPVDVNAKSGAARGVSAAEPERQSAVGGERGSERHRRRPTPAMARCRTTSRERSRPSPFAATSLTAPRRRRRRHQPPPATKPAAGRAQRRRAPPAAVNGQCLSANAPLSLSPQAAQPAPAAEPRTRVATNTPAQTAPSARRQAAADIWFRSPRSGTRPTRRPPIRALQGKFPTVLGSRSPVIKRADLGDKGVYYRAMVGPFGSPRRSLAVLRQPEDGRRTVRRPKELTAVSLTLGPSAG